MTRAAVQRLRFRPILCAAAVASAAGAQIPATASQEDRAPILVQGQPLTQAAARDRASQFVRAVGIAAGELPAARWTDPVCPVVMGLNDTGKSVAEAEFRRIAAEVGAPLAAAPCKENLAITFVSDAGAVARAIAEREPRRLAELAPTARAAVLKGSGAIRWWYTTQRRSRDGAPADGGVANSGGTGQSSYGSGYGASLPGNGIMHYDSSLLSTLSQRVITSAIVLVDTDDVEGRSLKAIAAYAALVGLAEIRDSSAKPAGSILAMFDSPAAPQRFTRQDGAFLKAVYRLPLDRKAQLHRGSLVRDMTRDMTLEPPMSMR